MNDIAVKRFYTVKEVAEQWGVHYNTVDKLIRNRQLTAVKIGRTWRISQVAMDAYLEKRTVKAK